MKKQVTPKCRLYETVFAFEINIGDKLTGLRLYADSDGQIFETEPIDTLEYEDMTDDEYAQAKAACTRKLRSLDLVRK